MATTNNIPSNTDSAEKTRQFFDRYYVGSIAFPSNQVDAVIGFFKNRGFDDQAAASVASVLLQQAKVDNVNVFELLDSLKGFDKVRLSSLVTVILNSNRSPISKLGFRTPTNANFFEARNILV